MALSNSSNGVQTIARLGLIAKGIVYLLIGVLAFMAAFEFGGTKNSDANKNGVFHFILELPLGKILLGAIALGLLCYSFWRGVQAFNGPKSGDGGAKEWSKRLRYALSGITYLSVAFAATRVALHQERSSGSGGGTVEKIFSSAYGQTIIIIAAFIIAAIGIYQVYYAFSEKYRKHISLGGVSSRSSGILLTAGKLGYTARGLVWLLVAWLLVRASTEYAATKAGDTARVFQFLEEASYGSYLLGALGLGLACYGVFNFIRARFETFE